MTVTASTDVYEVTIGDEIRYTITVVHDPELEVKLPEFGENLGDFDIKDFGKSEPKKDEGKIRQKHWYILDTFSTGTYTITAPIVKYTGSDGEEKEVAGNDVTIEVKSVIVDSEEPEDIMDITEPVNLPVNHVDSEESEDIVDTRLYILIGIGAVILIGAAVTTYVLLRRRKRGLEEVPMRPAHEIAYEQLQEIMDANLVGAGEIEKYYVLLSAVVRYYLENRFGFHAPEMTTEEFLQIAAAVNSPLAEEHRTLLRDFLTECDLVKFAQYGPDEKQTEIAFESAKRFVDETRSDLIEIQDIGTTNFTNCH